VSAARPLGDSKRASVMAAEIEAALEPLGIRRESREFVPHLTLARFESPRALQRPLTQRKS